MKYIILEEISQRFLDMCVQYMSDLGWSIRYVTSTHWIFEDRIFHRAEKHDTMVYYLMFQKDTDALTEKEECIQRYKTLKHFLIDEKILGIYEEGKWRDFSEARSHWKST